MKKRLGELEINDVLNLNGQQIKILDIQKGIFVTSIGEMTIDQLRNFVLSSMSVFTQNCQQRLVCGQLGSIASRMALGDNQATTIDGTHKGAGMVSAQGITNHIQYYFEQQSWITDWYRRHGLNEFGEELDKYEEQSKILTEGEEEISIDHVVTDIDFNGIHKEVNFTKPQKFDEV